jgi:hypothetical protein
MNKLWKLDVAWLWTLDMTSNQGNTKKVFITEAYRGPQSMLGGGMGAAGRLDHVGRMSPSQCNLPLRVTDCLEVTAPAQGIALTLRHFTDPIDKLNILSILNALEPDSHC